MNHNLTLLTTTLLAAATLSTASAAAPADPPSSHAAMAREMTAAIHHTFWIPERSLYRTRAGTDEPETIWGGGILFSMLTAAARHDPHTYAKDLRRFQRGLDSYWDAKTPIPGYEPCPTAGGGSDKYYDDNAWIVIAFAEAAELTGDRGLIRRAHETQRFVDSGWDDTLGGGIWWHEQHKDGSKNTCANAPAAVGCLTLAGFLPAERDTLIAQARRIADWTRSNLQAENGLYMDAIKAADRSINRATLTYNSALMLRAELMLHRATGEAPHLAQAKRIAKAADSLCHRGTAVYRDPPRWSHLMVEADLMFHRHTGDPRALERATRTAEKGYRDWKEGKPAPLMDLASVARALWLLVDAETPVGKAFWKSMDERCPGGTSR